MATNIEALPAVTGNILVAVTPVMDFKNEIV
jgi:hypothetical protein